MAYLSIRDVAERLHRPYVKIWQMCRSGHIPTYRIGRLWRIKEEDMEEIEKKLIDNWRSVYYDEEGERRKSKDDK